MRSHAHTHAHTRAGAHTHACVNTQTHIRTRTCKHTHAHAHCKGQRATRSDITSAAFPLHPTHSHPLTCWLVHTPGGKHLAGMAASCLPRHPRCPFQKWYWCPTSSCCSRRHQFPGKILQSTGWEDRRGKMARERQEFEGKAQGWKKHVDEERICK